MMNQEHPRMQSLREEIHEIMMENLTPLEEKLRGQHLSNCSVECNSQNNIELFQVMAEEYKLKQSQVTTMGKLVCSDDLILVYTIDLLTEEVNEKNQLTREYQSTIEEYKIQQEDSNIHIEQCEAALEDYKDKIEELELELTETKQLRERYQTMYEEEVSSKSTIDLFDNSKNGQSIEMDRSQRMEEQRHKMEVNLLDYQIKQLKLQIGRKDALIVQKQQQRSHLNQRFKGQVTKNQTLQGNFRVLQENFRSIVMENDSLKKLIEELEQKERQLNQEHEKQKDRERIREQEKFIERRNDSTDKLKQKSQFHNNSPEIKDNKSETNLRRSVSQSIVTRKISQAPPIALFVKPKNTLAFDLQSLQSGTSMLSPLASEIGKVNGWSFYPSKNNRFLKQRTPKSSRIVYNQRKISRSPSEISVSPARKIVTSKIRSEIKQAPKSIYKRCWQRVLRFLVADRLQRG